MIYIGSCECEAVKYRFEGQPVAKAICHCLPCQKRTASAFSVNLLVPKNSFEILQGISKVFDRMPDSGKTYHTHFCGDCGSTLYGEPESAPTVMSIKCGSLNTSLGDIGSIDAELYVVRRKSYIKPLENVKQYEGMLPV